ncbi:MAG: TlpA disulfide reductase family protein [Halieaceae bacterium]|jgi:thiol-disulfide isomerase/thioredoxin|nr:TlpA disulfide reductase family protein [Halieaceae bacterium]
MKPWLALGLLVALSGCGPGRAPEQGLALEQLRGQWVVINYWAIWCKPCIQEIPELNALNELPGVTVLGVNYDGVAEQERQQQIQQLGIAFEVLATDPAGALGISRPVVLPTTLVIDPAGELRDTLVGPQTLASLAQATGQETLPGTPE